MEEFRVPDTEMVIEKGTMLMFSISGLQYDSNNYDEPEKFNPDRCGMDTTADKSLHGSRFLAFGDGPRTCIGMRLALLQTRLAICLLLRKFKFELADEHLAKPLQWSPNAVVKKPINGIHLKVTARE